MIDLSTNRLSLVLKIDRNRLALEQYGAAALQWLLQPSTSSLFALHVNGKRFDTSSLTFKGFAEDTSVPGVRHVSLSFNGPGFEVDHHLKIYQDTTLLEMWSVIFNHTKEPCRVERVDSISLDVPKADYQLQYYTGDWGREFELYQSPLSGKTVLESRSGRSSKGQHPWFALTQAGEGIFSAAAVWSGNWIFRFEPLGETGYRISGGLSDWEFVKILPPAGEMEGVHVVLVMGTDLNNVSQQYAAVGRKFWYPRNTLSARQPVDWNHWWPYEDVDINEDVFVHNVEIASKLGMEICTLDAGWFGPSDAGTNWYEYRGDWHLVNDRRMPHGIRPLSDLTHARGMAFGLWCEIEGLGAKAQLARDHPDFVALRQGERLGYVCFGNPAVQEWSFQTLSRLITEYNCDWIKLDFNLDPGAGCDRTDHGHQAGDGLYAHYMGYYRTLDRIREAFPEVVLENCSSGGLRIDLGILRHTHMTFLSDPDWPVHDLQIFWGASTMLAADTLLHWGYCDWRNPNPPLLQKFNPHDPHLTQKQFDYYTRISMLGLFGYSQKLPDLPAWIADRITFHNRIYKDHIRRFVREGSLYRLTSQPRRSGVGERLCAFQYSLPDPSEHLLAVFRLPGADPQRSIQLQNLQPDRLYRIQGFEGEVAVQMSGHALMDHGLTFKALDEEDSALLRIY
jgi:alpha-galactosidase